MRKKTDILTLKVTIKNLCQNIRAIKDGAFGRF